MTLFPIPTTASGPAEIAAGPDGNLWFTELNANRIGRITPSGVIAEFHVPAPGSQPFGITTGPDQKIWFSEQFGNCRSDSDCTPQVASLDPATAAPRPNRA